MNAAKDLQQNILLMNGDVEVGIANLRCFLDSHHFIHWIITPIRIDHLAGFHSFEDVVFGSLNFNVYAYSSQEISNSVGNCAGINSRYVKLMEVMCGGGNPGIATGLEGAWGVLFVVSLLWIPLLFCMCQAKKHADQVRYGSLELRADRLEKDQPEIGEKVNVRILLGAPFNNVAVHKVARICMEVQDRLAVGADIPPKYFKVTSPGANNSILQASYWLTQAPYFDTVHSNYT